jgi:hypothetical protein
MFSFASVHTDGANPICWKRTAMRSKQHDTNVGMLLYLPLSAFALGFWLMVYEVKPSVAQKQALAD